MVWREVDTNKTIPREDLERIIIEAAKDIGLKTKIIQKYETGYGLLGSVKKIKKPKKRIIRLKKILPFAEVQIFFENQFTIYTWLDSKEFCFATEGGVEKYLEAVSKRVEKYQPQVV